MLSVFLLKHRAQQKTSQYANDLSVVLDSLNAGIYIIDPVTCRVQYLNSRAKLASPKAMIGSVCYETIRGCDKRCEACPAKNIHIKGRDAVRFAQHPIGSPALIEAVHIQWNGKNACLLACRPERNGKEQYFNPLSL